MRIAYLPDGQGANAAYRSICPMRALAARGHEVRELDTTSADGWWDLLRWCELLHIHRVCDGGVIELARAARATGAAVVWDDDDDVTNPPEGYRGRGVQRGYRAQRRRAARDKLFQQLDLVTTPSDHLAGVFRAAGAPAVQVIENYVIDELLGERTPRQGVRIGWVAGGEHALDARAIPIAAALERLLDAHPHVRVTTIGVRLELTSDRYTHIPLVQLTDLLRHVSAFDVGIAPLSPEVGINHARSNIKLKEYAAVGVPWLASPIGPYSALGEQQGGRLVADDRWFEELDALVQSGRVRRRLARRASRWGRKQLLSRNVSRWEQALGEAVARARTSVARAG